MTHSTMLFVLNHVQRRMHNAGTQQLLATAPWEMLCNDAAMQWHISQAVITTAHCNTQHHTTIQLMLITTERPGGQPVKAHKKQWTGTTTIITTSQTGKLWPGKQHNAVCNNTMCSSGCTMQAATTVVGDPGLVALVRLVVPHAVAAG